MQRAPCALYVEDDDADFALFEAMTEGRSTQVRRVASLRDAAPELERDGVDILLLDLNLPESRGIDTLVAARRRWPKLPVIVVTHSDDPELLEAIGAAGGNGLLRKAGFRAEALDACVGAILGPA